MHIIAETPRIVIREFKPEEEQTYLSLFDDGDVTLHLPQRNIEENRLLFIETLKAYAAQQKLGRWGLFNLNGDFMGMCLLRYFDDKQSKIEIGYALKKNYWGQGIAGEMAIAIVAYALKYANALQVVAVTTLGNTASQRVLEKAGLTRLDNIDRDGKELAYFELNRAEVSMD